MKKTAKHKILQFQSGIQANKIPEAAVLDLVLTDEKMILFTKPQTAEYFKVTESAISAWITQRRLCPTKVGSRTRISLFEIRRFLEDSNTKPHNPINSTLSDQQRVNRLVLRIQSTLERLTEDDDLECA